MTNDAPRPDEFMECDVLIVGAGPAGIAAAVTAGEAGKQVVVVDEGAFPGGQIWRSRGEPPKKCSVRKWFARLAVLKSVEFLAQSRVVACPADRTLLVETPAGARLIRWSHLILATGARERFLPFPGWTLPGVVGAGGLQSLIKQGLDVRGKRIVIAGTGPLLLAVADLARARGAIIPLILEQSPAASVNRFARSLIGSPGKLAAAVGLRARLFRSRYATGSYPLLVVAKGRGLAIDFRSPAGDQTIECDYLGCGFNLIPNTELPQILACKLTADGFVQVDANLNTTQPNVYAVGELTGIAGVDQALIEGCLAAHVLSCNPTVADRLGARHRKTRKFAKELAEAFSLRPEVFQLATADTLICRCEDVPLSALSKPITARDAKLQTRCGMGPCQGRVCGPILQSLFDTEPPNIRPPLICTNIRTLAAGKARE